MAGNGFNFLHDETFADSEVLEPDDDELGDWNQIFNAPEMDREHSEGNEYRYDLSKDRGDSGKENNVIERHQIVAEKDETRDEDNAQGLTRMELNDHKAGMVGLDKEKINQIIFEASKGSRFYENEMKKEKQVAERIRKQSISLKSITEKQRHEALEVTDQIVKELEKSRDLSRTFVHIDMDAFYAAVEILDNPALRDKPMAVGGNAMLSTSNYPARRYGVRAAMPGFIAKKLCPDLVIVPPHFDKYKAYSRQVQEVLVEYDPDFAMASLDEAYLDLTEYLRERQKGKEKRVIEQQSDSNEHSGKTTAITFQFGNDAEEVVKELRLRIEQKTRLTASAGIAPNLLLAKVCSDRNKPNGQFMLKPDHQVVLDFVQELPIRKISGIGRVSEQMLKALGIETCRDLYTKRDLLYLLHSPISFKFLIRVSLGLGNTSIGTDSKRKSIGTEVTFSEMSKPDELMEMCTNLCQSVAEDMKKQKLKGKTVTIKLKTVNFEVKSRSLSSLNPVSTYEEISSAAKELLKHEIKACSPDPLKLRLMGVRLSNLIDNFSDSSKEGRQNTIKGFLKPKKNVLSEEVLCSELSKECDAHVELCTEKMSGKDKFTENVSSEVAPTSFSSEAENDSCYLDSCSMGFVEGKSSSEPSCGSVLECPVCGQNQVMKPGEDAITELNKHIDLCLNKSTIREMVLETNPNHTGVDSTCASDKLRIIEKPTKTNRGKRKRQQTGTTVSKKATLHSFWPH